MAILIDTNVLLRLLQPHHPHSALAERAVGALRTRNETRHVAPQNLIEFWAEATRPAGENGLGMTIDAAAEELAAFQRLFSWLVVDSCQLLVSEPLLRELADVLARRKFDRYVSLADRQEFLRLLGRIAEMVPITYTIRACRDPKDDMILELAVNGSADLILTGDKDLLALNPLRNIRIITPARFLGEGEKARQR